ncbi:hypothetical protein LRAMOSA07437 [Lichtheimia ramosa]|uniref:MYND-type domain-containing protein n=1 Tax=Lichtheimia ramosa TaxID=688394 RepID=A0A077WE89_9FUNG|nr:hypothetical protein LRAMOSA07437 [Lichtheimia ramosa]
MTRSSPSSLHNGDTDEEATVAPTNTTTTTPPVTIDMECSHCNNSATFMCSSCGLAGPRYCSVDCQKIDWKLRHYKDCEATKAARRTRQAERAAQRESQAQMGGSGDIALEDLNNTGTTIAVNSDTDSNHHNGNNDEEEFADDLKFYMQQIYFIIKPVVACIILSIFWVKVAFSGGSDYSPSRPGYIAFSSGGNDDGSGDSSNNSGGEGVSDDGGNQSPIIGSLANALIIIGQIIIVTVVIVVLFRKGWMKVLIGFFMIVVLMLLGFMSYLLLLNLIEVFFIPMDYITMVFALWNFAVVGLVSIFWKGPLWLQQGYLTIMSSLMAFSLTGLEEWTTWILLGLLAVWDLIAVLCPFGPLRLLIESSRNQQREVPALLYSVNAVWFMMTTTEELAPIPHDDSMSEGRKRAETQTSIQTINTSINTTTDYDASTSSIVPLNAHAAAPATSTSITTTTHHDTQRDHVASSTSSDIPECGERERRHSNSNSTTIASRHEASPNNEDRDEEDAERSGLKLGLGDFVFYSVLIARAALYDWITTVCCTIAVLMGLTTTIFLLAIYKKALPALPISIAFGILFYFVAKTVLVPYIGALCVFGMVGL